MPFSRRANLSPTIGSFQRGSLRRIATACLIGSIAIASTAFPQQQTSTAHHSAPASQPVRHNELTLAGILPGKDTLSAARKRFAGPWLSSPEGDSSSLLVRGDCTGAQLHLEADSRGVIQHIVLGGEVSSVPFPPQKSCADLTPARVQRWKTGRGLVLGSTTKQLRPLYGDPDSKSPSSRGGQQLELWYYAFDWAGADVPQVMEVLCTKESHGEPGRVIEITLAAPSL